MIPRALYDEIRTLNAPAAKTLRGRWIEGTHSGAKITIAEAEQLYDVAGEDALTRDVAAGMRETKLDAASVAYRNDQKKKTRKRKKRTKR
jgi:hypothetical protein